VAIIGYGIAIAVSGASSFSSASLHLGVVNIGLIVGLSLINYALRSARWSVYLKRLGHPLPTATNTLCYLSGFAFTLTPGKAGEAGRAIHLKKYGVRVNATLGSVFFERLMDLIAIIGIGTVAMMQLPGLRWIVFCASGLALIAFGALYFMTRTEPLTPDSKTVWWRRLVFRVSEIVQLIYPLLNTETLFWSFVLGLFAWGCEAFGLYWLCLHLGLQINPLTACGIYAASLLAGALSFLPGGLGTTEATMSGMLIALAGASPSVAITATTICRVLTLWLAIGIGIVCNIYLETSLAPKPHTLGP